MILASEWHEGQEKLYQMILDAFESDRASGDTEFHFWLVDWVTQGLKALLLNNTDSPDIVDEKFQEFAQLVLNRQFGGPEVSGEFPRISSEG